jgi:hypothetical protein
MVLSVPAPVPQPLPNLLPRFLQIGFGLYFILICALLIYILAKIWLRHATERKRSLGWFVLESTARVCNWCRCSELTRYWRYWWIDWNVLQAGERQAARARRQTYMIATTGNYSLSWASIEGRLCFA